MLLRKLISTISLFLLFMMSTALAQEERPASPTTVEEEIFRVVEQMPIFYAEGCPESPYAAARACADAEVERLINEHLHYPTAATDAGVEGNLAVAFVINPDGSTRDHRVIRELGYGTGAEAIRVVKEYLVRWRPGLQGGVPVSVQYRVPFRFRLSLIED
ncbi:MAG: energy transducer TonB [Bacteroidota bacterium]